MQKSEHPLRGSVKSFHFPRSKKTELGRLGLNFEIAWETHFAHLTTKLRAGGMKTRGCTLWKGHPHHGGRCPSLSSTAPLSSVSNEAKVPLWLGQSRVSHTGGFFHATLSTNLQRFMKSILDPTAFPQFHIRSPAC